MRDFVVEVPVYIRVPITAPDADTASAAAVKYVDGITIGGSIERLAGAWQFIIPAIVPVEDDDAAPDVYLCSGGKRSVVSEDGYLQATGDDCDAAIH